jgi:hypothetical protein
MTDYQIKHTTTEPYPPWQNHAEGTIKEIKKQTMRLMQKTNTPQCLWDYCITYVTEIRALTSTDLYILHGRTPNEMLTGNTPDISEYMDYEWYSPLWYYDNAAFPETHNTLGRWLGVAHRVGQALCYWILTNSGQVVTRTTVQPLTSNEIKTQNIQDLIKTFDQQIAATLGTTCSTPETNIQNSYLQDVDDGVFEPYEPEATMPKADAFGIDAYLQATVRLPKEEGHKMATVL